MQIRLLILRKNPEEIFIRLLMESLSAIKVEIVLVPFPFDDLSASKSSPNGMFDTNPIGPHSHLIVSFISSRIPSDLLETDLALDSTQEDFLQKLTYGYPQQYACIVYC